MSVQRLIKHTRLMQCAGNAPVALKMGLAASCLLAILGVAGWSTIGVGAKPMKTGTSTAEVISPNPANDVAGTWVPMTPALALAPQAVPEPHRASPRIAASSGPVRAAAATTRSGTKRHARSHRGPHKPRSVTRHTRPVV